MAGTYTPPNLTDTPFPDLFSLISHRDPDRPLVQVIREYADTPSDCVHYTWREVHQHARCAADRLRRHWEGRVKEVCRAGPRVPGSLPVVVAVLAAHGYELYCNILACQLNRWTVLLISPKNSIAAVEHLLRTSHAALLLVDSPHGTLGHGMEQAIPGLISQVLSVVDSSASYDSLPFDSTLPTPEQLRQEMATPAFIVHTSGSTGHPKLIPWTHEFILAGARNLLNDGAAFIGLTFYSAAPITHARHVMGWSTYFICPLAHGNLITFVSSSTAKPPSAVSLLNHLPFIKDALLMLPPSILEELYLLGPAAVQNVVEAIKFAVFGGAPLDPTVGDALVAAGLKLSTGWGSTEIGQGTTHNAGKRPEDWQYVSFSDRYQWHFLPVDDNPDVKELVVAPGRDTFPASFNHENPRGYTSNDLWEAHPTTPGLWRHHSRKGNITILSNGEKTNNMQIETLLLKDKRILHVQVFGASRPLNGVILQPTDPGVSVPVFLSQIRPTVDKANEILPTHSRLIPELILVAHDKPFATTDKGTVRRKETLDLFDREIQSAYAALEDGGSELEWPFEGDVENVEDVKRFMRDAVRVVLGRSVTDEADLFESGMDSLLAIRLRSAVVSFTRRLAARSPVVPRNIVYAYPSINGLATYVLNSGSDEGDTEERIRRCIAKFTTGFIPHQGSTARDATRGKVVALSGTTGAVGSFVLTLLLRRDDVERIYLLSRPGDESQRVRHERALEERGLDSRILDIKESMIVYLDVDLSQKHLGLSDRAHADLRDNVTHIIHAAWQLNFNLSLESYERVHVAGVRHLIDLALASPHVDSPRLIFLSTIAAAAMYHGPSADTSVGDAAGQVLVPETPLDDPSVVIDQGYAQGKYVSERVIAAAVAAAGLRATVTRVGQLSGATTGNGAWATTEYIPMILRSSLALGVAPDDLRPVRWVPHDIAASAIVAQSFDDSSPFSYFSVENPFPTEWAMVVAALAAVSPRPLEFVSLQTWLDRVRSSKRDVSEVPAVKLLEFYGTLAERELVHACLGWGKSVELVPELARVSITPELVERYIRYQQGKMSIL